MSVTSPGCALGSSGTKSCGIPSVTGYECEQPLQSKPVSELCKAAWHTGQARSSRGNDSNFVEGTAELLIVDSKRELKRTGQNLRPRMSAESTLGLIAKTNETAQKM